MDRGECSWTEIASRALSSLVQTLLRGQRGGAKADESSTSVVCFCAHAAGYTSGREPGTKLATKGA